MAADFLGLVYIVGRATSLYLRTARRIAGTPSPEGRKTQ